MTIPGLFNSWAGDDHWAFPSSLSRDKEHRNLHRYTHGFKAGKTLLASLNSVDIQCTECCCLPCIQSCACSAPGNAHNRPQLIYMSHFKHQGWAQSCLEVWILLKTLYIMLGELDEQFSGNAAAGRKLPPVLLQLPFHTSMTNLDYYNFT